MSHHIVSNSGNITFVIDNRSYVVAPTHANYEKIKNKLSAPDKELLALIDVPITIQRKFSNVGTGVTVENGEVMYNGQPLHNSFTSRILAMIKDNFDVSSMLKFLSNMMQNPSYRSRQELYDFLADYACLPITDDGCFLAYKSVNSEFLSKHENNLTLLQGKLVNNRIYNGVGEVIECPRGEVDDNGSNTCSQGLHVGGLAYSGPGGDYNSADDKVIIVKVNPADAVSVPTDHQARKLRVCKYEVVGEYQKPLNAAPVYNSNAQPHTPDDYSDADAESQGYDDGYYGNGYDNSYAKQSNREAYLQGYREGVDDADTAQDEEEYPDYEIVDAFDAGYDDAVAGNTYDNTFDGELAEAYDDGFEEGTVSECTCECQNPECEVNNELGKRPDGTNYYNRRGPDGKFKKKS